ncbi:MAG TPA: sulfotransferase, partial [Woeseiaceae bacterium]|nr:sulfotransferase [Woeseiaceae bacterium]
ARCKQLFTREFFAARAGWGASAAAPVFVIGLPRTGSTLVEQILASHSDVEGTMELTQIADIARSLAARGAAGQVRYPEVLASLTQDEARTLGERYLERTRVQRKRGARHFIDKMPNNFAHIALIRLILPNAIVIDVRRHPLACGLSLFKHLFAHGQHFSYSLEDIGRYYRDYVELMRHFDAVLPGYVHRVTYESLVEDTDAEVRRLLEYCGLPFEGSCLRFFDNRRAVNTASSEQVRTPIFHNALDHWRHYEPWLDPLREQVAPSLSSDPE